MGAFSGVCSESAETEIDSMENMFIAIVLESQNVRSGSGRTMIGTCYRRFKAR